MDRKIPGSPRTHLEFRVLALYCCTSRFTRPHASETKAPRIALIGYGAIATKSGRRFSQDFVFVRTVSAQVFCIWKSRSWAKRELPVTSNLIAGVNELPEDARRLLFEVNLVFVEVGRDAAAKLT
jgi:hypothetical protein